MSAAPAVGIVGAGFGGLAAALELKGAGIESFTVLEREGEVGGVWQANTYPGAACDVPSVIYQFSGHLKPNWSRRFGLQEEIRDYLREVSIEAGVREHIRFHTEVVAATYEEQEAIWRVELADGETLTFDVLICATGQLSRPRLPELTDSESFQGAQFHSAQWDHSVDLAGRRVVVVGGGASAIQVVPAIVDEVEHLTVVQRSPSWVVGKYDWTPSRVERQLTRRFPALLSIYHHAMWWYFESRYPLVLRRLDPLRRVWEAYLRRSIRRVVKDPAKAAAATPDYALGCNRLLLSSEWYPTIARPDVDLIRAGVTAMTPTGIVTSQGEEIEADVVIWCTGFTATEYLAPIRITGRGGLDIREAWADGPEAYLGLATAGFPNMFMSYGPNTGSLTNTLVSMVEYQASYMRQAIEYVARKDVALDIRSDVHSAFVAEAEERLAKTVFTSGCPGWYTTESGRVTTVWFGSHVEYRRRTRTFDPAVYEELPRRSPAPAGLDGSPLGEAAGAHRSG
jgi:cation diffusion facilitator CzcD-associated flavoprotein CzcO